VVAAMREQLVEEAGADCAYCERISQATDPYYVSYQTIFRIA
jgi:hypothetical protein